MGTTYDSNLEHGTTGSPQQQLQENDYQQKANSNEKAASSSASPKYMPSQKHEPGHNFGSVNPIATQSEGQTLLDTGYHNGKQVYNITDSGKIVKFQPDNTPQNGYHSYEVSSPRDIPPSILKQMLNDGRISRSDYNKLRKGKK